VGLYSHERYHQRNAVFHHGSGELFRDASVEVGPALRTEAAHRGAAFGDLNNDGRVDAVVSAINGSPEILYNVTAGGNHWILIQTEGRTSNRDGIGARIKLTSQPGVVQYNQVTTSGSYASASDKRVHFGLGKNTKISEIEVRWPSGKVQVLRGVTVDQVLKIQEE
jgi:hypothetical protein